MNGLLGAPLPEFEEVFPGQKPLDQVGQPKQDAQGLLGAINKQSVEDPLYSEPLVSQQIATKDYSQIPKSEWQQQFEKEKTMPGGVRSVFDNDMLSVYMRDKYNAPLAQSPEEEEFLNRNNLTRDDVRNIIEQTPEGQDFLNMSFSEMGISPEFGGTGGTEGVMDNALSGSFSGLGSMDLSGMHLGKEVGGIVKGAGRQLFKNMGVDSSVAGPLMNSLYTAATTQDVGSVLKQAKKDGMSQLVNFVGDFAEKQLGTKVPIASLVSAGMRIAGDVSKGMDMTTAIGDSLSNIGINIGSALVGSLFGPIGTIVAPIVTSMLVGDNLFSEGILGDAFDSRNFESFRDAYEDMDLSREDMATLDRMTRDYHEGDLSSQAFMDKFLDKAVGGMGGAAGGLGSSTIGGYHQQGLDVGETPMGGLQESGNRGWK
jgi:hypothetical protein